jgi:hypothetical protein
MVVDIPTPGELASSSIDLLNMAWDSAFAIIAGLESSEVKKWDDDGSAQRDYHAASQRSLANALAITQQAQELGLKSRITAVSPYLLIAGDPRGWPKSSAGDLSFSEFRTIDASDLIRVHNTVCSAGVDDRFVQAFEDTRRRRNLFVHLGRHQQSQDAKAILILILRTMKALFPDRRWPSELYDFARRDRYTTIGGEDYVEMGLVNQFEMLRRILPAKELKESFNFDKRARRYICQHCTAEERHMSGTSIPLAQLRPNRPEATTLYCCTCDREYPVARRRCPKCKSDVYSIEDNGGGVCLTCFDHEVDNVSSPGG